ncbi:amidohydrolase family protein [Shewanella psychrotolerans]|uniref:amidohydrolase family protein n=1 Tax=Shewanella psychrotolerans TaxID=2864206 RepID=UPI001C65C26D|nr:amidohydrolase family protein [Shewanella psychrotolerans]QYK02550.1 amidohydrolase family protein [Shewanella psychrotolerans]
MCIHSKSATACIAMATLVIFSAEANSQLTDNTPKITALTNATLMVEPGDILKQATLLIENSKIKSIITNEQIPDDAYVIDMTGKVIYPGFIDPYTDYAIEFKYDQPKVAPPIYEIKRMGGNAENGAIHAEKEWFNYVYPNEDSAKTWLTNGFTSVQTGMLDGIFRGRAATVSLAPLKANDIIYRAKSNHLLAFDKGSSIQDYPSSLMGSMALIRQTLADAKWYNANIDKSLDKTSVDNIEFNIALERLENIEQESTLFETKDLNSLLRAASLLKENQLSGSLLGNGREYARIDEVRASGFSIILPLNFPAAPNVKDDGEERNITLAELRHWERAPTNPYALEIAKIPFALTMHGIKSDAFWPRLKQAINAGLSKQTALAALTTEAAEIAGISDISGRLKAGYMADLVIADGDLFESGKIESIWLQGQENQLIPRDTHWLTSNYQLTLGELTLDLTVTQGDKLSGILSSGEQEITLNALTYANQRLTFTADLSEAGYPGINRFTLWFDDQGIHGRMLDKDNSQHLLAGVAIESEQEVKIKPDRPIKQLVSKLTQPNVAYGVISQPDTEKIHLKNATIWTSAEQGIIENSDLLISRGKIEKIGKNINTPSGYQVIDATGKHITAGIIDEHSHIALNGGTNEGSDAVTSEVRIGDVLNPEDIAIYRALAGGVTTAQLLHGSANPIGGQAQVIKMRWGENAEGIKFQQAPASIKFALGENVKQSNWGDNFTRRFPQSRMGVKSLFEEAFNEAIAYEKALTAYDNLRFSERRRQLAPKPNYRLQAISEVINGQRDIHIHSYVQSEILMFIRLAEAYDFKVSTFTHVLEGYKVADEIAKHGAYASTFSDWWAYKFEVYDAIPQNTCLMHNKGVLTSINSDDYEMQRRLNQEAAKSVMYCDMNQVDAWNMVTINPAKQLGIDDYVGSIEPGKQADIVLWDHSPLSVYAKVDSTWIEGRRYFDRAKDKAMQSDITAERAALIQAILTSDKPAVPGETPIIDNEPQWHCDTQYDVWRQRSHAQKSNKNNSHAQYRSLLGEAN